MSSVSFSHEAGSADDPMLGVLLRDSYRVVRVAGRGALSTVYEGEHVRLRRRVAIQLLSPRMLADEQALSRFRREAELVAQLQHPNVAELVDFDFTDAGQPYLVLEYLTGHSLRHVLEQYGRLDARKAARIVHQIACGLHAAHRAGIVHRALNPGSVFLVDVPGEGTLVKLLDLALGKLVDPARRGSTEHERLAPPDYVSPEHALGDEPGIDARSDQYSLAVIAYEAISGRVPFLARSAAEVLDRILANDPVPIERFVPEVPSAVGQVLRRGMAKAPADRFATVLDFAAALLAAAGCTLPPPGELRAALRPLLEEPTPPPLSFIAPRPDGRYHTPHQHRDAAPTDPPGPYPETVPPEPEAETEPPSSPSTERPALARHSAHPARLPDADRVLDLAREAFGLGDLDLAVSYADSALHLGAVLGGRTRERVDASRTLLESIFLSRIGSQATLLVAARTAHEREPHLSPEQAFLLSRLDTPASVEEMLDVSPLPRRETLRDLVSLLRQGAIRLA